MAGVKAGIICHFGNQYHQCDAWMLVGAYLYRKQKAEIIVRRLRQRSVTFIGDTGRCGVNITPLSGIVRVLIPVNPVPLNYYTISRRE